MTHPAAVILNHVLTTSSGMDGSRDPNFVKAARLFVEEGSPAYALMTEYINRRHLLTEGERWSLLTATRNELETLSDRLEVARRIVESVAAELNREASECKDCGHKRYENWAESQIFDILEGVKNKLTKVIGKLRKPGPGLKGDLQTAK